jgi:hypothetical protein
MNRKGQAINEELIRLLPAIGWFILIALFAAAIWVWISGDAQNFSAEQNLKLLAGQIEYAHEYQTETSIILSMPKNHLIAGFDPGEDRITFADPKLLRNDYVITNPVLERPRLCSRNSACICVFEADFTRAVKTAGMSGTFSATPIACQEIPGNTIVGTQPTFAIEITGFDATVRLQDAPTQFGKTYSLAMASSHGVKNVRIQAKGDEILVMSPRDDQITTACMTARNLKNEELKDSQCIGQKLLPCYGTTPKPYECRPVNGKDGLYCAQVEVDNIDKLKEAGVAQCSSPAPDNPRPLTQKMPQSRTPVLFLSNPGMAQNRIGMMSMSGKIQSQNSRKHMRHSMLHGQTIEAQRL